MNSDRKIQFQKVLRNYCVEYDLSVAQVAKILNVSVETVSSWYRGRYMPRLDTLKEICCKLRWNYEALFSPESRLDRIYTMQYLSFDSINDRYLELLNDGAMEIMAVVSYAAVALYNRLIFSSVPCRLKIDVDQSNILEVFDDNGPKLNLTVKADGILKICLLDPELGIFLIPIVFSEAGFSGLVNSLKLNHNNTDEQPISDTLG